MKDDLARLLEQIDAGGLSRRAFLNRSVALGATAVLARTFAGSAAQAEEPKQGGTLLMGMGGGETTDTLDPALYANPVPGAVGRQWGDTLVNVTADGQVEMGLAESVSSNADGSVWTFKIREGVKFHDGSTMTPDDVVATYKRHSDENSKSGALGVMQGIADIKADGSTVVVTLKGANADLPYLMADYHLIIQPKGGVDNPNAGIGTGPYKIVSADPGVHYVFAKNTDDWNTSRGHYDGVEILVINDSTARAAALQSGQVHVINRVDPKVAKLLGRAPGVKVQNVSGRAHYVFVMQCDAKPFDNNDMRLALKYAINRPEMVEKILGGYGGIGNDIPINAAYPLFDDAMGQRAFDLAKAAEHYKASGHDGSPIELIVADTAFPGAVDAAALFQASCQQAGIPLEIKKVPDDGYWSDVWNVKPFCASYWIGRPVQDQMYSTAYLSTADWNDTRFKNPEFDALILQARAELDPAKRKEIYGKVAGILNGEGGAIIPMFNDFVDAVSESVAGWSSNPNGELMDNFISSKTWLA